MDLQQSHVCVSTTARAGNDLGYDVLVVSDAVGDRDIPGVFAEQLIPVRIFCSRISGRLFLGLTGITCRLSWLSLGMLSQPL